MSAAVTLEGDGDDEPLLVLEELCGGLTPSAGGAFGCGDAFAEACHKKGARTRR